MVSKLGNKYINDTKPWASETFNIELSNLYHLLRNINKFYIPVFGLSKINEINSIIDCGKKYILFDRI